MNGVDEVVVATGNDWRAIEAGAHAHAAGKAGGDRSLTSWEKDSHGDLVGTIELPMAVGPVGGATAGHPTAKADVRLLVVKTAQELAEGIAAGGVAGGAGECFYDTPGGGVFLGKGKAGGRRLPAVNIQTVR